MNSASDDENELDPRIGDRTQSPSTFETRLGFSIIFVALLGGC
jgi:hypothetical protein